MTQPSLFTWAESRPAAGPRASEQGRQVVRVGKGLAPLILDWLKAHQGETFHLSEITRAAGDGRAPDSVRRIMGELRRGGFADVVLLDRSRSLYECRSVMVPR